MFEYTPFPAVLLFAPGGRIVSVGFHDDRFDRWIAFLKLARVRLPFDLSPEPFVRLMFTVLATAWSSGCVAGGLWLLSEGFGVPIRAIDVPQPVMMAGLFVGLCGLGLTAGMLLRVPWGWRRIAANSIFAGSLVSILIAVTSLVMGPPARIPHWALLAAMPVLYAVALTPPIALAVWWDRKRPMVPPMLVTPRWHYWNPEAEYEPPEGEQNAASRAAVDNSSMGSSHLQ